MPQLEDVLAVLRSVMAAATITVAAYGFGRALAHWFECAERDRLERGVCGLLLGYPAVGFGFLVCGLFGCLGTVSVSLVTLVGLLSASAEIACSIAHLGQRSHAGALQAPPSLASPLWYKGFSCISFAVLIATLISALAPPTDQSVFARTLDAPSNALAAETFWNGTEGGLRLISLPQIWSMWGLALDGPVAASLVHWQVSIVVTLATVLLARHWVSQEIAWLAGMLALLSAGCWTPVGSFSAATTIGLSSALVLLAALSVRQRGRRAIGQVNFAMAALVASLPATSLEIVEFNAWQYPFLLIALSGLALGSPRQKVVFIGCLTLLVLATLLPNGSGLLAIALPGIAVAGAAGAASLLNLPTPLRGALVGLVACLALVHIGDLAVSAIPKTAVALGGQSRASYLLATCGSYRAAMVFNQIRLPEHRLYNTTDGCLYFASSTTRESTTSDSASEPDFTPARIVAEAERQGCDYLLLAERLKPETRGPLDSNASGTSRLAGEPLGAEKFAGAIEVIPIVEYEFADEYQRTTRYRLWKLQSRRAAASPTFETATSGEGVSSRPRPLTR